MKSEGVHSGSVFAAQPYFDFTVNRTNVNMNNFIISVGLIILRNCMFLYVTAMHLI